jgi:hypothetical protein
MNKNKEKYSMRLNAPKKVVFTISVILIILGLVASLVSLPPLSGINNWLSFAGGGLLSLACLLKGL